MLFVYSAPLLVCASPIIFGISYNNRYMHIYLDNPVAQKSTNNNGPVLTPNDCGRGNGVAEPVLCVAACGVCLLSAPAML